MKSRLEGGRTWQPGTRAILVLPAFAVVLGLMGVTSGPLLAVREARQRFGAAEQDLEHFHGQAMRLSELRRLVDSTRVAEEVRLLDGFLPAQLEPLDVFTLLRLAARSSGLELEAIELGPLYDLLSVIDGETVYMQDVRISAPTHAPTLIRFLNMLREAGFPTVALELSLVRKNARQPTFQALLHLGLLHRGPPPPSAPGAASTEDFAQTDG